MTRYVYLMENREKTAMKIGVSLRPKMRASGLGCALLYAIEGDLDIERMLHRKFEQLRINGEWFKHSKQIAGYFIRAGGRTIMAKPKVGRPAKMTPCPYCERPLKSRDFQTHVMRCPKRKAA